MSMMSFTSVNYINLKFYINLRFENMGRLYRNVREFGNLKYIW